MSLVTTQVLTGCGETQARSFDDKSSNYCGMRELYCGEREACRAFSDLGDYVEKVRSPRGRQRTRRGAAAGAARIFRGAALAETSAAAKFDRRAGRAERARVRGPPPLRHRRRVQPHLGVFSA